MTILFIVFFIAPLFALAVFSLTHVAPFLNRHLFDRIWQDPSAKQKQALLRRVRELTAEQKVPEATALLMAAKELNSDEDEALRIAESLDPADIARLASGTNSGLGSWVRMFNSFLGGR